MSYIPSAVRALLFYAMAACARASTQAELTTTLTSPDPTALAAAVQRGGVITLAFSGSVALGNSLPISTDTTVDASGYAVSLDGGGKVRHFEITNGATLRLVNLTLANGKHAGGTGQTNEPGQAGWGGAIYNAGGRVELSGCRFVFNQTTGGAGGTPVFTPPGLDTAPTPGGAAYGGAIYSWGGELRATNCLFAHNQVTGGQGTMGSIYTGGGGDALGGAIFCTNTLVNLVGVSLSNNLATAGELSTGRPAGAGGRSYGGALALSAGTATVTRCQFVWNEAIGATKVASTGEDTGSANGGALFLHGEVASIDASLFRFNRATGGKGTGRDPFNIRLADGHGGAIYHEAGRLELRDCALISNEANGGNAASFAGAFQTYVGGAATGGGIHNRDELVLVNCTLALNAAQGGDGMPGMVGTEGSAYGGALFQGGGGSSLLHVTLATNTVKRGRAGGEGTLLPGIKPEALGSSIATTNGTVALTSSILAGASPELNVSGSVVDGGHNISSDQSPLFTLPTSRSNLDPRLGPIVDFAGPLPTVSLLPDSPALDAADAASCPEFDQRGVRRPQGGGCDIGAFELAPRVTLARKANGAATVEHHFRAGVTNQISASTNLMDWAPLGLQRSNAEGITRVDEVNLLETPLRFYRVLPELIP